MKRIIVIDDDAAILDAMATMLSRSGFIAEVYNNAAFILQPNFNVPDLFLIDRRLPGMDGLEVCSYLKSNTATRHVPVILFSASPAVERMAVLAGADAFIEKPFTMRAIRNLLHQFTSA